MKDEAEKLTHVWLTGEKSYRDSTLVTIAVLVKTCGPQYVTVDRSCNTLGYRSRMQREPHLLSAAASAKHYRDQLARKFRQRRKELHELEMQLNRANNHLTNTEAE